MKINGAWYLDAIPNHIVMELEDGALKMFYLTPFREIQPDELLQYKGYHPRKCKGQPLPDYLYRFYGLEKNDEALTEAIRTRVTPSEKARLDAYAKNLGKTTSELIRDQIREWIKK